MIVARTIIETTTLFDVFIQNISPTFIIASRNAGYISFDGYLHSVASSLAEFHDPLLLHSIVDSDAVTPIHVASAPGSTLSLSYRFSCHTRFASEQFVEYITCALNEYGDASASATIEPALGAWTARADTMPNAVAKSLKPAPLKPKVRAIASVAVADPFSPNVSNLLAASRPSQIASTAGSAPSQTSSLSVISSHFASTALVPLSESSIVAPTVTQVGFTQNTIASLTSPPTATEPITDVFRFSSGPLTSSASLSSDAPSCRLYFCPSNIPYRLVESRIQPHHNRPRPLSPFNTRRCAFSTSTTSQTTLTSIVSASPTSRIFVAKPATAWYMAFTFGARRISRLALSPTSSPTSSPPSARS